jgi:hypothetical protein
MPGLPRVFMIQATEEAMDSSKDNSEQAKLVTRPVVWDGAVRVVIDEHALQTYTARGWVLLDRYEAPVTEHTPVTGDRYGSVSVNVVSKTYFLLGQDRESTMRALADANEELRRAANAHNGRAREAEAKLAAAEKAFQEEKARHHRLLQDAEQARQIAVEERKRSCKMELDLAKVRAHFGEKAMNEALAGKK